MPYQQPFDLQAEAKATYLNERGRFRKTLLTDFAHIWSVAYSNDET